MTTNKANGSVRSRRSSGQAGGGRSGAGQGGEARLKDALLAHKQLKAARDYAEAIIEEVSPLLVLDPSLRVQTVNDAFCKCFRISARTALSRKIYELGNGQWNIPK